MGVIEKQEKEKIFMKFNDYIFIMSKSFALITSPS